MASLTPTPTGLANAAQQILLHNVSVPNRGSISISFSIRPNSDTDPYRHDVLFPTISPGSFANFPVCQGAVKTTEKGYAAIYGWVQLWKSGEDAKWEFDSLPIADGLNWPFAWFGPEPQLFDGPVRVGVADIDWTARSFLTYVDGGVLTRVVRSITGFEWGFRARNGIVSIKPLKRLALTEWDDHAGYLATTFPGWTFCNVSDPAATCAGP